jgi:hypothetical protein
VLAGLRHTHNFGFRWRDGQVAFDGISFAIGRAGERANDQANPARRKTMAFRITDPSQAHAEGRVAKAIEQQTSKLPSDLFLWAAGGSMAASLMLKMAGRDHDAQFVGQWAPTLLILGLYNKLVKLAGSE